MDSNFESMSSNGMPSANSGYKTGSIPSASNPQQETSSCRDMNNSIPAAGSSAEGSSEQSSSFDSSKAGSTDSGKTVPMNDRAVACDLLISAKESVKAYADAITEAATPSVRSLLKRQLNEAIAFQDQIGAYVTKKGWYNAYNMNQQILIDLDQTQTVVNQLQN